MSDRGGPSYDGFVKSQGVMDAFHAAAARDEAVVSSDGACERVGRERIGLEAGDG